MPHNRGMAEQRTDAPATVAFAGGTLDRAAHLRGDAEQFRASHRSQVIVVGQDQQVALTSAGTLALTPAAELPSDAALTFLGLDAAGRAVFAYDGAPAHSTSLRSLMTELDPADAALAAYAVGMVGWHRVHRHCGRCGHATEVEQGGHRRRCPNCGLQQFPRTDPAVTMLVQSQDRCLLSRRHGAPPNRWSALAGFVEPGETPEEAVVLEDAMSGVTSAEAAGCKVVAVPWIAPIEPAPGRVVVATLEELSVDSLLSLPDR